LFLQDNAAPHKAAIAHQKLADLHFGVLKHPANSPHLAPSDYHLLPNLKKHLKGRKFSSIEEATSAADGWFAAQPKEVRTTKSQVCGTQGGICRANTFFQSRRLLFSF
jgi:hypothetical protein